jgi:hypothetical protein
VAEGAVDMQALAKDGKNSTSLICQRCGCIILRPNLATLTTKEVVVTFQVVQLFKVCS